MLIRPANILLAPCDAVYISDHVQPLPPKTFPNDPYGLYGLVHAKSHNQTVLAANS